MVEAMFKEGDRISWRGINRDEEGVVESVEGHNYHVRLDNGFSMVVHEKSARSTSTSVLSGDGRGSPNL